MCYYHWCELVRELDADIEEKAMNDHEFVFLGKIPQEAITWYGTVEESERHFFKREEEHEDFEQVHQKLEGDSLFSIHYVHILMKNSSGEFSNFIQDNEYAIRTHYPDREPMNGKAKKKLRKRNIGTISLQSWCRGR